MLSPYLARSVSSHWPFRGRQRLAQVLGARLSRLPAGDILVTPDGRRFRLRRDPMYWRLFLDGDYHATETEMLRRLVDTGDVVVDVGANFGAYTTLFARSSGETGHVHAFEPSKEVAEELRDHVALNQLEDRVTVNRCGLTDRVGNGQLFSFPGRGHGLSSTSDLGNPDAVGHRIALTTLDAYCSEHHLQRVDVVKVDVEGAEMQVLRGAGRLLDDPLAPVLVTEINADTAAHFGYRPAELLGYLRERHGYDVFLAYRRSRFVRLPRLSDARHGEMIVAAKVDVHAARLRRLAPADASVPPFRAHPPHVETTLQRRVRECCPVCGGHEFEPVGRMYDDRYGMPDDFDLARCSACGSHFLVDYVDEADLPELYRAYYGTATHPAAVHRRGFGATLRQRVRGSSLWSYVSGGVDLAAYVGAGERVLDVGCGYATNAAAVQHRGASWTGIDVDEKVCEHVREAGLTCFHGTLSEFARQNHDRFDTILLSQVIEHAPSPVDLLTAAKDCLAAGGRVLLSCPNGASRYRSAHGQQWLHWHVPYHVVQLTPESIRVAAARAHLSVDWCRTSTPPSWYLAQKRIRPVTRGVRNPSFRTPFEPAAWLALTPFLRLGDALVRDGGDALVACLRSDS